jgi:PAS domain S-box-containing protein
VAADSEGALVAHLLGGRISADVGQLGVAAVAVWVFWDVIPVAAATTWMTVFVLGVVARTAFRRYAIRPDTPGEEILSIVRRDVWIGAAMWGAFTFLVMGAPVRHMAMLLTIFAGLVAAATSSLVADTKAFLGFAGLLLVPLALSVGLTGLDREHAALLVLLLLFAPFMAVAYRRAFGMLSAQIRSASQLRISEEETARSRDFLNALVSSAPSPIVVLDDSGTVLQANPAFHYVTGRDNADLTGESFTALVTQPGDERNSLVSYLDTVRDGARSVAELPLLRAEGTEIWMRLSGTRARGRAAGTLILVGEDVTDQVVARAAQEQARNEAEAAGRAKTAFLASMSHEIRTPLHGVLGMVDVLLESSLTTAQREAGEVIRSSGQGLLRILNDVLDVSKIEAGQLDLERVEFDLHKLLQDTARIMTPRAVQGGNKLLVEVGEGVPKRALSDAGRLGQVLTNLLDNAVKFTTDGEVVLSVQEVGRVETGTRVAFSVKDTGVGVPEDMQERIFEEFEQAHAATTRTHGGTGLGLAISRRLVALLGGTLEVESVPGEGSDFKFVLDLDTPEGTRVGRRRRAMDGEALRGRRFLVIDDNATARRIAREALVHLAVEAVVEAGDVDSGMRELVSAYEIGEPFDAVILDHLMPRRDGFDFAAEMLANPAVAETPVLMVTSAGMRDAEARAREMGIQGFLSKPTTRADLMRTLSVLVTQGAYQGSERRLVTKETITGAVASVRVLLAEDNAVSRRVAVAVLERQGYEVDAVVDGEKALAAVQERPYDIVLMDIQMPAMDGLEATRRIRSLPGLADLPVIALTAHAFSEERGRCEQAGMNDFLAKPFKPDDLFELVERWVSGAGWDEAADRGGEQASALETDPPVDIAGFRAVMKEAGVEEEVVDTTLQLFQPEAREVFARLQGAIDAGEPDDIRTQAHMLRASSGTIRATGLADVLGKLESLVRAGDVDGAKELFPDVAEEYGAVMDYLGAREPRAL